MLQYKNLQITFVAPLGYDAATIMFNAIKKSGTNKEELKNALKNTNLSSITYDSIQFDNQGDLTTAKFEIKQIKNKQAITYYKE